MKYMTIKFYWIDDLDKTDGFMGMSKWIKDDKEIKGFIEEAKESLLQDWHECKHYLEYNSTDEIKGLNYNLSFMSVKEYKAMQERALIESVLKEYRQFDFDKWKERFKKLNAARSFIIKDGITYSPEIENIDEIVFEEINELEAASHYISNKNRFDYKLDKLLDVSKVPVQIYRECEINLCDAKNNGEIEEVIKNIKKKYKEYLK